MRKNIRNVANMNDIYLITFESYLSNKYKTARNLSLHLFPFLSPFFFQIKRRNKNKTSWKFAFAAYIEINKCVSKWNKTHSKLSILYCGFKVNAQINNIGIGKICNQLLVWIAKWRWKSFFFHFCYVVPLVLKKS